MHKQLEESTIDHMKQNKPTLQLIPIEESFESLFGKMKGTIHIVGDIISPIDEIWDAKHKQNHSSSEKSDF